MGKYRKKPKVIEAWLNDGQLWESGPDALKTQRTVFVPDGTVTIATLEGDMRADVGDWIIKGVDGELYPCKPDIFEATYEEVNDG